MLRTIGVLLLLSNSLWSYHRIEKMEQALPFFSDADSRTLVVFDIDYTLTMPSASAFHMALFQHYKPSIKVWIKNLTDQERFYLAPYIVVQGGSQLIEKNTPKIIAALQQKGAKTLALTACPSLALPGIGPLVEWRRHTFQLLGIDFSSSFPSFSSFTMTQFKEQYGVYPGYYQGILFCNSSPFLKTTGLASKGEVLRHFLETAAWKPAHVIMLDDDSQNLESVGREMETWGVAYTGLLYAGAQTIAIPSLSKEEMEIAWKKLIQMCKIVAPIQ